MRQVASVVKDGRARYFIADTAEGSLDEFATVVVPDTWGAEQAVKLGFNLIAAVGLNGARTHVERRVGTVIEAAERELAPGEAPGEWDASKLVAYVEAHPGVRPMDIAAAFGGLPRQTVQSALTRARAKGQVVSVHGLYYPPVAAKRARAARRAAQPYNDWSHITREMIVDYIRAHPGCTTRELTVALLGVSNKQTRQVIGNRIASIKDAKAKGGDWPGIESDEIPDNTRGGVPAVALTLVE